MITENLSTLKIYRLTEDQYKKRIENGSIEENALYLTPDEAIDLSPYATKEEVNNKADLEHNHDDLYYTESEVDGLINNLETTVAQKQDKITGASSTIVSNNLEPLKVLVSNNSGKVAVGNITSTELSYLNGTSSNIQIQLNNKANVSHTHNDIYYTEDEINDKISTINSSISEAKSYTDTKNASTLEASRTYTDNAFSQLSQVQIITWESDD